MWLEQSWTEKGTMANKTERNWDDVAANSEAKWIYKRWNLQNDLKTKEVMQGNLTEYELR